MTGRAASLLGLAIAAGAAALVFAPARGSYFLGDDFAHLFDFAQRGFVGGVLRPWGGHLFATRNTLWWLILSAFGPRAEPFFQLVLLVHVANTALLFLLARRLTASAGVATWVAVLWGTLPVHAETLTWLSVSGQVIATTLVLLSLLALAGRPGVATDPSRWRVVLAGAGVLVATTCYAIAVPVAVLFPLLVWAFGSGRVDRTALLMSAVVLAGVAAQLAVTRWLAGHDASGPLGMLLTYASGEENVRRVMDLWGRFLLFSAATTPLGLLSTRVGVYWPIALATAVGLATAMAVAPARPRRQLATLVTVVVLVYALAAAGRATVYHLLGVPPDVAAATQRYHYLAGAAATLALGLAIDRLRGLVRPAVGGAALGVWLLVMAGAWLRWPPSLELNEASRVATRRALDEIRAAAAAAPPGTTVIIPNRRIEGNHFLPFDFVNFPGLAGLHLIFFPNDEVDGRSIRFRVSPQHFRLAKESGGRLAGIVTLETPHPPHEPPPPQAPRADVR